MHERWEYMNKDPKYGQISPTINTGLGNLRKWYLILNDSSIYFICLILDPCIKMSYFQKHWEDKYLEVGTESLERIVFPRLGLEADL